MVTRMHKQQQTKARKQENTRCSGRHCLLTLLQDLPAGRDRTISSPGLGGERCFLLAGGVESDENTHRFSQCEQIQ